MDRDREQGGLVVEVLGSEPDAEAAVRALHDAGFGSEQISIVVHDSGRLEQGTTEAGVGIVEDPDAASGDVERGPDGISVGGVGLVIPGIGIVIGGPLAVMLSEGDAPAGGLVGALGALGVPEGEARAYQERYDAGGILVAVAAGDREQEARSLIQDRSRWAYRDELRPI